MSENTLAPEPKFIEFAGQKLEARAKLTDFRRAEKSLGVPLFPFGQTKTWDRATPLESTTLALYVLFQHSMPDVTVEWIEDNLEIETYSDLQSQITEVVKDFFSRLYRVSLEDLDRMAKDFAERALMTGSGNGLTPASGEIIN